MGYLPPEQLKKYSYFYRFSDGALRALSEKLTIIEFPAGTEIIKEGSTADAFFFIGGGVVEVLKKTRFDQNAKISIIGPNESVGEMALLTCSNRTATVVAKTDVTLYRLKKQDFEDIAQSDAMFSSVLTDKTKSYDQYNEVKILQPFALLEPEKMLALFSRMTEHKYSPGQNIITQGEKGEKYYIIKSGKASVIRKDKGKDPEQIAVLTSGQGFGEEAMIREKPRNATVQATEDTTVLVLEKKDFDQILRKSFIEWDFPEDIPEDQRGRYVFIDARVEPEYEDEHIEGAINIPLEILREKYDELDKNKEYYTYCTTDSRGMSAAFLMKSMGFKVKTLRGGLSAWDGPVAHGRDGIHYPDKA
jgi:CRP-like cAMP-binding protein